MAPQKVLNRNPDGCEGEIYRGIGHVDGYVGADRGR